MRGLARRLLATEAAAPASEPDQPPAVRVNQRLRASLIRLIGADGFVALQRRALLLARPEIPSLQTVDVTADGRLEGIEALADGGEAATAITAHVLELLVVLIGEPLTLRLMHDAFPDTPGTTIGEPKDLS